MSSASVTAMTEVAPFTGAWIETQALDNTLKGAWSHPSRVRGLKLVQDTVAYISVWSHPSRVRGLKRPDIRASREKVPSHPSRVRGLKHKPLYGTYRNIRSHPSRVRGLKQAKRICSILSRSVAPFTGAWIETS